MKKVFGLLFLLFPLGTLAHAQEVFVSKEPGKRKAVIEEYTGVRCGNCPDGHRAEANLLKKYPGQLFAVNIHAGSYADPMGKNDPNLTTPDGSSLLSTFKIPSFPAAVLNRHMFDKSYVMEVKNSRETEWGNYMQQIFAMDSYVNIAAKGELDWATRKLSLTVQLYYTGEVSGTVSNRIHVAMLQDGIISQQSGTSYNPAQITEDGRYRHLHVLRDMLTPIEGDAVTPVGKDSLITRTYEWVLPDTVEKIPLDLVNTNFVVYVAESQYEIFSACEPVLTHIHDPETLVGLSGVRSVPSYSCDLDGRASFTLTNRWGVDIEEVTFALHTAAGEAEYTYKASSVLKAGQEVHVLTDAFAAVPDGGDTLEIEVKAVNGKAYGSDAASTARVAVSAHHASAPYGNITLNVVQDRLGEEITWNLRDMARDIVLYTGGPYHKLPSVGTRVNSVPMSLDKGCYALTVLDEGKDGINGSFGEGNINFVSQGEEFYRHDGKYADSVVIMLDVRESAANGKTERAENLTLRPNPADDHAVVSFTAPKTDLVRVRILNRTGACVLDLGNIRTEAGNTRIELPLQGLVPGMYFVSLRGEDVNLSSKLVIAR